jgi:CBS domain-containing protein
MTNRPSIDATPRLILYAATAADLMTSNPVSIAADATAREASAFLSDKGFSAAPVIDEAGRPIGVLSQSDLVIHHREKVESIPAKPEYYEQDDLSRHSAMALSSGLGGMDVDRIPVRDIMTPIVFSVALETAAHKVIEDMLAHKIHRLFVVDHDGVLVGIISTIDVLRHLHLDLHAEAGLTHRIPPASGMK